MVLWIFFKEFRIVQSKTKASLFNHLIIPHMIVAMVLSERFEETFGIELTLVRGN